MKFVIDTSAITTGLHFEDGKKYYLTKAVLEELNTESALNVEIKIDERIVYLTNASNDSLQTVKRKVEEIGEEGAISKSDISILALAYDFQIQGDDVSIITDDYGIQNVSTSLGMKYIPVAEKGISKQFTWHFKCIGCGEVYDQNIQTCGICGSRVKRRVKHKK